MPLIPVESVYVGERLRELDENNIKTIMATARRVGILQPIIVGRQTVLIDGVPKYPLDDGANRHEAVRRLGHKEIWAEFSDDPDPKTRKLREFIHNYARAGFDDARRNAIINEFHWEWVRTDRNWTQEKTGALFNLTQSAIAHILFTEKVAERHPEVAAIKEPTKRLRAARRIVRREEAAKGRSIPLDDESPIKCGDFLQIAPIYNGVKADFLHVDFPYGINSHNSGQAPSGYHDTPDIQRQLWQCLREHLNRLCAPDAHIMFWFAIEQYTETRRYLEELGFTVNPKPLVWVKKRDDDEVIGGTGITPNSNYDPRHIYETAFFGRRGHARIIQPKDDVSVSRATHDRHQHEKPVPVLLHFFEMVVDKRIVVLDPTCGSGTSLIAAHRLGAAHVIGFEKDTGFAFDAQEALQAAITPPQPNGARVPILEELEL